jgi:DNA polymerase III delta prime subunit
MRPLPLIEKQRPKEFEELVGIDKIDRIKTLISKPADMPNLLFYGPAGTGKTTTAKIILDKLKPIDFIRINGSDTTGVDTIRERVYNFVTSRSTNEGKPKIIWIEEFDYQSKNAFAALRSLMEQFMSNGRFIVTLNYLKKIPAPIQSRFTCIKFRKLSKEDIVKRLKVISDAEGIEEDLEKIAILSNGDMRTAINMLQTGIQNDANSLSEQIFNMIKEGKWKEIRYDIPLEHPDYNQLLGDLDMLFFNSDLSLDIKRKINEIIATGSAEMNLSFSEDICFSAICSRIMRELE